jgi:hypothetical protein
MAYVRTVKSSRATAVQIVWSWRKGSRSIEHLGSAHDDVELAALKASAAERLAAGQTELDLGISGHLEPGTLPILSSQMTLVWETLCAAYRALGFESAAKRDNVFRDLVLARIIEPTSKIDAERVLTEVGLSAASYAMVKRRLPRYVKPGWRQALAAVSAAHARVGPASLVLFDVSTLYFETDAGDGFREPGFSNYAEVAVMPRSWGGVRAVRRVWLWWTRHNRRGGLGLQSFEEVDEVVSGPVTAGGAVQLGDAGQGTFLDRHVGMQIDVGGHRALVPQGNDGSVDAGVQQRHRRGMPQGVRGDLLRADRRAVARGGGAVFGDEPLNGVGRHPGPPVRRERRAGGRWPGLR